MLCTGAAVRAQEPPERERAVGEHRGVMLMRHHDELHLVDQTGKPPTVQCAQNKAAFPGDATDCNVLNFIPTEIGYAGGAWNLQVFTWKAGVTPTALTKDDDIIAAATAGLGTLVATNILVRCPLVNFAALR